jgi:hypothetical protein
MQEEEIKLNQLSDVLVGEWQPIEVVDIILFGDTLWHEVSSRGKVLFNQDSIATFYFGNSQESSPYATEGNEAIIFGPPSRYYWTVLEFDAQFLEISEGIDRREGEFKSRWRKLE